MRDAAVGFQCVECVKKGAKDTRSGRTAYGGLRPTDASATSIGLIVAQRRRSGSRSSRPAASPAGSSTGSRCGPRRTATSVACSRCDPTALTCPCGGHAACPASRTAPTGRSSPRCSPTSRSGTSPSTCWRCGCSAPSSSWRSAGRASWRSTSSPGWPARRWCSWAGPEYGGTHGASGAIFGLMGALLVIAIKVGGDVRGILTWIGINFLITFVLVNNISWQGHLGGFVGGLACAARHRLRAARPAAYDRPGRRAGRDRAGGPGRDGRARVVSLR